MNDDLYKIKDDLIFLEIEDDPNFQDPQTKGWGPSTNENSVCPVSDVCLWQYWALNGRSVLRSVIFIIASTIG